MWAGSGNDLSFLLASWRFLCGNHAIRCLLVYFKAAQATHAMLSSSEICPLGTNSSSTSLGLFSWFQTVKPCPFWKQTWRTGLFYLANHDLL